MVSAASIAAKVTRDTILHDWVFKEQEAALAVGSAMDVEKSFNRMFGCGYPGDATTKAWLKNSKDDVFGFPSIVRFSWSTSRKMLQVDGKDLAYWYDLFDEEKKNSQKGKGKQMKLVV